jgi:5'(3')-deoxyribonucleotidase
MARKKKKIEEKKVKFGITIDPYLNDLLKEYVEQHNISVSKFIEQIIKNHFENK